MNRDEITRMAREAGFVGFDGDNGSLRRFAAIVAAAEREECAKVCENLANQVLNQNFVAEENRRLCAKVIRARGSNV